MKRYGIDIEDFIDSCSYIGGRQSPDQAVTYTVTPVRLQFIDPQQIMQRRIVALMLVADPILR